MYELSPRVERQIVELLSTLLDVPVAAAVTDGVERPLAGHAHARPDLTLEGGGHRFLVEYKSRGETATVAAAVRALTGYLEMIPEPYRGRLGYVPLVVVPAMGTTGEEICARAAVSWMDLAGNARVTAPGLRVWVEGRKNPVRQRRPRFNPYAPKASRIPRALLLEPARAWTQSDLVAHTELDKGLVSNVVRQLERDGHVVRGEVTGVIGVADPNLLLDAWGEVYTFARHEVRYGTIAARSGPDLLRRLVEALADVPVRCAATGLAAAAQLAPFAEYRTVTCYVDDLPSTAVLGDLGFREGARGSNLWLTIPNDVGVFDGARVVAGVPCVSAVQCYLDLASQPERAPDAARELRARCLTWDAAA